VNIACVIGNGTSRLELDLHCINATMTTYGCNALYRDFMPNYLIAMDYPMVKEILNKRIQYQTSFHTQHDNRIDELKENGEPINFFWGMSETNDSGNSALRLALQNKHDVVYMIGFDYCTDPSTLSNVYVGTNNYVKNHMWPAASMREEQWGKRLRKILKNHPNQKVVRVNGTKPLDVNSDNYEEITIQQFKEIYE
jgi:hypothetical protein